ncbi:M48 family metalloprotease [Antrihabitans stalactiti]|jgi:Zn-dependent peptidase ImmA (M78 family)|uniref:Peptidase M48 domain-containing protein n=1 Tax=Antrihabitans stalactiti TaxID=2584121 RepID=A0A848KST2_9NOCA|nr:M48 family metalloprotease [Antrihabitans stalactiti]NMN99280.1 hypothetical protein [Antrihabitans stalactiti]
MTSNLERSLRRELTNTGLTRAAIDAVWPEWWSSDAESSTSASAELRYTVARRLGISPRSLFDGPPVFMWRDEAKFKNLGGTTPNEQLVLTSFGVAVGRALISAAPDSAVALPGSAIGLREAILASAQYIQLSDLLAACWGIGIPVVKTNVLPLRRKRMHAMSIRLGDRYAILIGLNSRFPAQVAFIIAHELGHIAAGHITDTAAILDIDNPLESTERDDEELQADGYALALLTGHDTVDVVADVDTYNATQVANAAMVAAESTRIDPGTIALCLAYSSGRWRESIGALKIIPGQQSPEDVGIAINSIAARQLQWGSIGFDRADYLRRILSK